jgi:nucleoside phosphorylase
MRFIGERFIEHRLKGLSKIDKASWVLFRTELKNIQKNIIITDIDLSTRFILTFGRNKYKAGKIYNMSIGKERYSIVTAGIGYPGTLFALDILKETKPDKIIRFGFCASANDSIKTKNFFIPEKIISKFGESEIDSPTLRSIFEKNKIYYKTGRLFTNDVFISSKKELDTFWLNKRLGNMPDCIDMESYFIFDFCKSYNSSNKIKQHNNNNNNIKCEFGFIISDEI